MLSIDTLSSEVDVFAIDYLEERVKEAFFWIGWGPKSGRDATLPEFLKIEDTSD